MAFEWIPVERHLHDSREVIIIARVMQISRDEVVGLIVRFMSWVDGETVDGDLPGLSLDDVDAAVERPGFGTALLKADMVSAEESGVYVKNFRARHGPSARARLMATERKKHERDRKKLEPQKEKY